MIIRLERNPVRGRQCVSAAAVCVRHSECANPTESASSLHVHNSNFEIYDSNFQNRINCKHAEVCWCGRKGLKEQYEFSMRHQNLAISVLKYSKIICHQYSTHACTKFQLY